MRSPLIALAHPAVPSRDVLAATALEAAGGGVVAELAPVGADRRVWRATVAAADGSSCDVRLDAVRRTAEIAPRPAVHAAA